MRKIPPLEVKHHREIVWMSETGAPGILKGPLNAEGHNRVRSGEAFVCVRTSAGQIWEGKEVRVSEVGISL